MLNRSRLQVSSSCLILAALVSAAPAYAQVDDEIVVTAQRRAQNVQDVPISVTAISGDFLDSIGAVDITDVQKITPNATIEVARGSNSTLIAFIRGVGQQDPLWGFEPGVGIYVDDVYVARPQGSVLDIFDVERVEVLRGPQGTLYGRNTIGGAIKYVTKGLNMEDPELKARINVGSYGQFDQILSGSLPVSDTFAIGAAVANYQRSGFGDNLFTGASHYNKDILAARVSAEWSPTQSLNFRLAADMTDDDSNAKHGHRLLPSGDGTIPVTDNEYDTRGGAGDRNEVKTKGVSFTGSWDVNEAITLKSITAYREGDTVTPIDFDALPQQDFDVPANYSDDQFSQEFQILYSSDRLSGVAGVYYLDGSANGDFDLLLSSLGLTIYQAGDQKKENLSAYADFTYDVTDALSVSLGGRYTEDKTVADVTREVWFGLGSASFDAANTGSIFLATQTGYQGLERKDSEFSPRIAVSYKVADNTNVYGSFSQGFKAGGFDPRARADLDPLGLSQEGFGPETVDSYELGVKGSLFENRLTYSLAGFVADYNDQQITTQQGVDSDNDGTNDTFVSSVFNAGSSQYKGLEFEGALRLSENFTLSAMAGYIDAEIEEILSAGVNIADNFETQNTPELTSRFGFAYTHDVENHGSIMFTGSAAYRDDYFLFNVANPGFPAGQSAVFPEGGPALDPDAYTVFDLGAKWTSESGMWDFGIYGRNLTDERARVAAYNFVTPGQLGADGAYSAFYRAPRTVSATLGFKY
ncbi:TonB-dependent receptor [Litorimonas cladophorae]|uniref:TonB-dependent receptor n=1 Tax=Litorimonas cladophorae TaxID=1220491 RepID=A0A918NHB9_9PROT|nr:TonB-dependent receptor [Litorimonas cladophorae]GGX73164.1 TonB-dependent receptor [Litorimonas cladophorae]